MYYLSEKFKKLRLMVIREKPNQTTIWDWNVWFYK